VGKWFEAKKDVKNVMYLKELQISISTLKRANFKDVEKIRAEYEKVYDERYAFVKAHYAKEGWAFNY